MSKTVADIPNHYVRHDRRIDDALDALRFDAAHVVVDAVAVVEAEFVAAVFAAVAAIQDSATDIFAFAAPEAA